eukprot:988322-Rhodomonas_salina.1
MPCGSMIRTSLPYCCSSGEIAKAISARLQSALCPKPENTLTQTAKRTAKRCESLPPTHSSSILCLGPRNTL